MAPNDSATRHVRIRVPRRTPEGVYRVKLTAETANGARLPEAIACVRVAPAVSLTAAPQQPSLLQDTPATVQVGLTNNDVDQDHTTDVSLQAPDGWTVQPASRSMDLPAGATTTTTFTVTPPPDASGPRSLTLSARGEWGSHRSQLATTVSPKMALVGDIDLDTGEFALSPNRFDDYPSQFPDDVDFTVGADDPASDWSYIHPRPSDGWAGGQSHTFTLRFDLDHVPDHILALTAWLLDTQESGPPTVEMSVNGGPSTTVDLPRGGRDGYHWSVASSRSSTDGRMRWQHSALRRLDDESQLCDV